LWISDINLIALVGCRFLYPIIYFSHHSYIYFRWIWECNTFIALTQIPYKKINIDKYKKTNKITLTAWSCMAGRVRVRADVASVHQWTWAIGNLLHFQLFCHPVSFLSHLYERFESTSRCNGIRRGGSVNSFPKCLGLNSFVMLYWQFSMILYGSCTRHFIGSMHVLTDNDKWDGSNNWDDFLT
jgi:hypothetical protein